MEERHPRKLAVILHADVVGSTALVQQDEGLAHARIHNAFGRFSSIITAYNGTTQEIRGDALVAEFDRASDAVEAALTFQAENTRINSSLDDGIQPKVRVGISLGEVVFADNTVTGEGVILAQRLEQLADSGGVCIQGAIYEAVPGRLPFIYQSLGEQELKGFSEPVRAYSVALKSGEAIPAPDPHLRSIQAAARVSKGRWILVGVMALLVIAVSVLVWIEPWQAREESASMARMAFPLPSEPSIAVLPFDNMSGDPAQDAIADGFTESLITILAQMPELFVIARNTTFTYKDKPVTVKQVAEELGVRYVLEGSIQREGQTLRINAQLIDAVTGHHLWANKYDRGVNAMFAVQDELVRKIFTALQVKLTAGEHGRVWQQGTENFDAYLAWLEGWKHFRSPGKDENAIARQLILKAIDMDPDWAMPYTTVTWTHWKDIYNGWSDTPEESLKLAEENAQKALALDDTYPGVYAALGAVQELKGNLHQAIAHHEKAVALGPNISVYHAILAENLNYAGRSDEAVALVKKAMRLEPTYQPWYLSSLGDAYTSAGKYEEAVKAYEQLLQRRPESTPGHAGIIVNLMWLGRESEARGYAKKLLEIEPNFTLSAYRKRLKYEDTAFINRQLDALRKAGVPDDPPLALPDKPSIAVLPFTNMSGDPEQEYFADGMTDDLITDLSKISGLVVIARNSTFAYKGKSPDVRKVASDLNVRYVLEGSVRRAADQVRINAQLIDGESGHHLWADRYDGAISDIFTLQDRMTRKIVSALAVELTPEEQAQTATRETENIAAYDAFLQGWGHYNRQTGEEFAKAIKFFERAIELDPDYATASAALALSYWMGSEFGGLYKILGVSWREIRHRSRKYIDLAMKKPTAVSYMVASPAALKQRRYEDAIDYAQRAVQLDPNNAEAHRALAYALFYANRAEEAIGSANRAMRLDPSNRAIPLQYIGRAHFALGNYEKAVEFIERARDVNPKVTPHSAMLAAALVHLGRDEEAKSTLAKYNATWGYIPSVREVMYFWPFKDPDAARRFAEGLVKAGLPPPPSGYYVLSEEERLESDEIRALVFGRDVTGFDPWSGEQWWIKRDADGQFSWRGTAEKSWSGPSVDADRGKSWIEGNLLCERWEVQDFQICIPLFRNPNGTKEGKDEYVSMYDTGIYPWSTVE